MIRDEDAALTGYVYIDLETTDYGGFRHRADKPCTSSSQLPAGYRLKWSGEYEFELRAKERLTIIVPIVFVVDLRPALHAVQFGDGGAGADLPDALRDHRRADPAGTWASTSASRSGSGTSRCSASRSRPASSWWSTCTKRSTAGLPQGSRSDARPRSEPR